LFCCQEGAEILHVSSHHHFEERGNFNRDAQVGFCLHVNLKRVLELELGGMTDTTRKLIDWANTWQVPGMIPTFLSNISCPAQRLTDTSNRTNDLVVTG